MKIKLLLHSIILIMVITCISCSRNKSSQDEIEASKIKGPYLGQTPPGYTPELFAPGIVADIFREHSSAVFTPDGKEVFWTRQVQTMTKEGNRSRLVVTMHMKQINGIWTKPTLAPFNDHRWTFITYITRDGNRIYFDSTRPIEGEEEYRGAWYVEKTENGWSEPKLFTALDKWDMRKTKVQVTDNGNIYFSSKYPKPALEYEGWWVGFYRSKLVNGEYQEPELLDSTINTANYLDYGFYVAPNEEYIIFNSSRPGGYSSLDMYISYQETDGSWGEAVNLGEKINTFGVDGSNWPFVSPDSKYLFFMTSLKPKDDIDNLNYTYKDCIESQLSLTDPNSKICWVSADFIEELKPDRLK